MGTVTIHDELKDLEESISWCKNRSWEKITYSNKKDHEHCIICYWSIFYSQAPSCCTVYVNGNNYLCSECFTKFLDEKNLE